MLSLNSDLAKDHADGALLRKTSDYLRLKSVNFKTGEARECLWKEFKGRKATGNYRKPDRRTARLVRAFRVPKIPEEYRKRVERV